MSEQQIVEEWERGKSMSLDEVLAYASSRSQPTCRGEDYEEVAMNSQPKSDAVRPSGSTGDLLPTPRLSPTLLRPYIGPRHRVTAACVSRPSAPSPRVWSGS